MPKVSTIGSFRIGSVPPAWVHLVGDYEQVDVLFCDVFGMTWRSSVRRDCLITVVVSTVHWMVRYCSWSVMVSDPDSWFSHLVYSSVIWVYIIIWSVVIYHLSFLCVGSSLSIATAVDWQSKYSPPPTLCWAVLLGQLYFIVLWYV